MLDYKKLRKEFKEVLSKIGGAEIDKWLNMDAERLEEHKQETVEEVAKRIALETFNETFSNYPRGGKISNETLTDALILFFRLGSEWQQQNKNLYSEEEVRKMFSRYNEVIAHRDVEEWQPWIDKQFKK